MSNICWVSMIAFLAVTVAPGFSQEKISHEVKFPTGDAAWTVVIGKEMRPGEETKTAEEIQNAATQKRAIKSIDIVRIGKTRRDTIHWSDATTTEYWWIDKLSIILMRGRPGEKIRSIKANLLEARSLDASIFAWVGEKTFQGIDSFKGKKAQRYQMKTPVEDGGFSYVNALIDPETSQPLMWSDGSNQAFFSFDASLPDEPLVMPPDFQEAFKSYEALYAPAQRAGKR